MGLIRVL